MIMLLRLVFYSSFCIDHHADPHSILPEEISSTLEIIQGQIYLVDYKGSVLFSQNPTNFELSGTCTSCGFHGAWNWAATGEG